MYYQRVILTHDNPTGIFLTTSSMLYLIFANMSYLNMKQTLLYLYTEHNLKSYALERNDFRVIIESWDKDLLQLIINALTLLLYINTYLFS